MSISLLAAKIFAMRKDKGHKVQEQGCASSPRQTDKEIRTIEDWWDLCGVPASEQEDMKDKKKGDDLKQKKPTDKKEKEAPDTQGMDDFLNLDEEAFLGI